MESSKQDQRHSNPSQTKLYELTDDELFNELFERGLIISMSSKKLTERRGNIEKRGNILGKRRRE